MEKLGQKKKSIEVRWHGSEPYLRLMGNIRNLTNTNINVHGEFEVKALAAAVLKSGEKTAFVDESKTNPPKKE